MGEVAPKCPSCGVTGTEHITCDPGAVTSKGGDPWFEVAYCDQCGHVYGVFAKVTLKPTLSVSDIPDFKPPHLP